MAEQKNQTVDPRVHDFALRFLALYAEMGDKNQTEPILGRRAGDKSTANEISDQSRRDILNACDTFFDDMKAIAQADRFEKRGVNMYLNLYRPSELSAIQDSLNESAREASRGQQVEAYQSELYTHVPEDFPSLIQTLDHARELNGNVYDSFNNFVNTLQEAHVMDAMHVGIEQGNFGNDPAAENRTPGIEPLSEDEYWDLHVGTNTRTYQDMDGQPKPKDTSAFGVTLDAKTGTTSHTEIPGLSNIPNAGAHPTPGEQETLRAKSRYGYNTVYTTDQMDFAKAFVDEIARLTPQTIQQELHVMGKSQAVHKLLFRDEADAEMDKAAQHFNERAGVTVEPEY